MKNYKKGFDFRALILFAAVMIPNLLWFAFSAPNDVLRAESVTPAIDTAATILQVVTVAALCFIVSANSRGERLWNAWAVLSAAVCGLYYVFWMVYYLGIVTLPVLLGLCLFPCAALILFAVSRNNYIALVPAVGFTVLHTLFTVYNFF